MKNFYVNFITSSILYNQVYCTDKSDEVKIATGKLQIKIDNILYNNEIEITLNKNEEINIDKIKQLIINKKFKRNDKTKTELTLDEKGKYKILSKDKNCKIENFLKKDLGNYVIEISKYYTFHKDSIIKAGKKDYVIGDKEFIVDSSIFSKKNNFEKNFFNNLENLLSDSNKKLTIDINGTNYYIDENFYEAFKSTEGDKLDKNKFEKLLEAKIEINLKKYEMYSINSINLSEELNKKYNIKFETKDLDSLNNLLKFKEIPNDDKIRGELKKRFKWLNTIDIKNKDNKLDIIINNFDETKLDKSNKYINHKKATIKIETINNIYIKDKEKYKSKTLDFKEGNIDTNTDIKEYIDNVYINKTYPKLKNQYDLKIEGDNGGKFKDGTIITIKIKDIIEDVTTNKDPNKIYINVKFEVSDNTKYKLKENILKLNNNEFEFEKDSKYKNLIEKIKENLGNTGFKDGFVVLFNNINFTTDNNLTNDGIYTFKLDNEDKNFVEEIVKEIPKEDDNKDDEEKKDKDDEEKKDGDGEEKKEDDNKDGEEKPKEENKGKDNKDGKVNKKVCSNSTKKNKQPN